MENIVFSTTAFGGFEKNEVLEFLKAQAALEEQRRSDMQFKIDKLLKELERELEEKKEIFDENLTLRRELDTTTQQLVEDQKNYRQLVLDNQSLDLEIQLHQKSMAQQNRKISIQSSEIEIEKLEKRHEELVAACEYLEEHTQSVYDQIFLLDQQLLEKAAEDKALQKNLNTAKKEAEKIILKARADAEATLSRTKILCKNAIEKTQTLINRREQESRLKISSGIGDTPIADRLRESLKTIVQPEEKNTTD